jgi:hypothetical protein
MTAREYYTNTYKLTPHNHEQYMDFAEAFHASQGGNMKNETTEKKLETALDLLNRAASRLADESAPDPTWWPNLFALTGEHMILTDEGWESGDSKQSYIDGLRSGESINDVILGEINAPEESVKQNG